MAVTALASIAYASNHNKSLVAAAGGRSLTVAVLRRHAGNAEIEDVACETLAHVESLPEQRVHLRGSGMQPMLIQLLQRYVKPPSFVGSVAFLLGSSLSHPHDCITKAMPDACHYFDARALTSVVPASAAPAVARALIAGVTVPAQGPPGMCSCASNALANAVARHAAALPVFVADLAGVHELLGSFRSDEAMCQRYAMALVCRLAAHKALVRQIAAAGVIDVLHVWLGTPPTPVDRQLALTALVRLSASDAGRTELLRRSPRELIRCLVTGSFRRSDDNPDANVFDSRTSTHALADMMRALANLARSPAARGAMRQLNVMCLLVATAKTRDPFDPARCACAAIRAFAMGDGCEVDIVDEGGLPALANVLRGHLDNAAVLVEACGALWNVLGGGKKAVHTAALAAGVDKALISVLAKHGPDTDVGRFANGALDCLMAC